MAKSVSVAVGESETMRTGRFETVTLPAAVVIVTGNGARWSEPPAATDTDTASAAASAAATRSDERST